MKIKIKPKSYYKRYYNNHYNIWHTGTKYIYYIAYKYKNTPIVKYDEKLKWGSIKEWEIYITGRNDKIEKISKGDLFLELL